MLIESFASDCGGSAFHPLIMVIKFDYPVERRAQRDIRGLNFCQPIE